MLFRTLLHEIETCVKKNKNITKILVVEMVFMHSVRDIQDYRLKESMEDGSLLDAFSCIADDEIAISWGLRRFITVLTHLNRMGSNRLRQLALR
jgi:hypothetical protein